MGKEKDKEKEEKPQIFPHDIIRRVCTPITLYNLPLGFHSLPRITLGTRLFRKRIRKHMCFLHVDFLLVKNHISAIKFLERELTSEKSRKKNRIYLSRE